MDVWVLMSGGIDSAACARYFQSRGDDVEGVYVDYGQQAAHPESQAAESVATHLDIKLSRLCLTGSRPLGSGEINGRNAFLVFSALMGLQPRGGILSLGIHSGTPYYDCGTDFVDAVGKVVQSYSNGRVQLFCPFLLKSKLFVYQYAKLIDLPINLTYSCEQGTVPPCGQCFSCRDRNALEAS